jgi:hypothetical protein
MCYSLKCKTFLFLFGLCTLLATVGNAQPYPAVQSFVATNSSTLERYYGPSPGNYMHTVYTLMSIGGYGNAGFYRYSQMVGTPPVEYFYELKYRSKLTFNFNNTIPSDATINAVQISLGSSTNTTLTATIGKLADGNITEDETGWNKFASGSNTIYYNNIAYNTGTPLSVAQNSALWNDVIAAITAKTTVTIFIRSNYESTIGSNSFISSQINVLWTPKISVTVQNNVATSPSSVIIDNVFYTSPKTVTWDAGSSHTLRVNNQTGGGLIYPFIEWRNITAGNTLIPGNPISVSPTSNTTYQANFGPGVVGTTIDQKLSTNVSADYVGIWEGGSFANYLAPAYCTVPHFSDHLLRCEKVLFSQQGGRQYGQNET